MPLRKIAHDVGAARTLRRKLSLPEGLLWRQFRREAGGIKFRRQHPVGPYVLDFYCASAKLGVEVDGISHDMSDRPSRDVERDAWLRSQGIEVVRVPAGEVLGDPVEVAARIVALCGGGG